MVLAISAARRSATFLSVANELFLDASCQAASQPWLSRAGFWAPVFESSMPMALTSGRKSKTPRVILPLHVRGNTWKHGLPGGAVQSCVILKKFCVS